jgi:hypothetical protein
MAFKYKKKIRLLIKRYKSETDGLLPWGVGWVYMLIDLYRGLNAKL